MNLVSFRGTDPWPTRVATVALFLVPALGGTVQSGYSYGAVMLLIAALLSLHRWPRASQSPWTWALALVFAFLAVYWYVLAPSADGWGRWDRTAKFVLGIVCLLFVARTAPRPRAQFWGLLVGCIGVGLVALWQVHAEGEPRASGFPTGRTNAIQWGNLVLLLGTMLAVQTVALHAQLRKRWSALSAVAVVLALNASVLSGSRGGWLALVLLLPLGLYLLWRLHRPALWPALLGGAGALALVAALNHAVLSERWEVMANEVRSYGSERVADNSVGQRLEHWRFAWDAGMERPWLGWGMDGYLAVKAERVAAGQYQPAILEYIFVHNELLDMFVKAGIVGVLLLLLTYLVPLCMFWPSRARLAAYAGQPQEVRSQMLALRVAGACIPLLYAGFGLTQVYFAHNSGIMPYLFLTMVTWAALQGMDAQTRLAGAGPDR
jgi:O-antigen ligase